MRRLASAALCLAAVGCGSSEEAVEPGRTAAEGVPTRGHDAPVAAVQAYLDAVGAGNFASACRHIAAGTLERVTSGGEHRCVDVYARGGAEVEAARRRLSGARAVEADVDGDAGTVTVRTGADEEIALPVVREAGAWKVAS